MRRIRQAWHDDGAWVSDRRTRNVVAFLVIVFMIVGLAWVLIQPLPGASGEAHHKSPTWYGVKARSTLHNGARQDSVLCVQKYAPGRFTARAKGYSGQGRLHTVKDSTAGGGQRCNETFRNLHNHRAGSNPWGGSNKTYWGGWSVH